MAGKSPYGVTLTCNGTTVANVVDIDGPGLEAEDINVTDLDSPDQFEEFVRGQINGGQVTLQLNLNGDESSHVDALLTGFAEDDPEDATVPWVLAHSLSSLSLGFNGYVKSWSPKFSKGSAIGGSVTIKVTGKPSFID